MVFIDEKLDDIYFDSPFLSFPNIYPTSQTHCEFLVFKVFDSLIENIYQDCMKVTKRTLKHHTKIANENYKQCIRAEDEYSKEITIV